MRRQADRFRELPPTAGLPLRLADLAPFGRAPPRFAQDAAAFLGVESLTLTCSGTAALIVALTTLRRLSARREVIVPAFTCPLVALAIAQCGLELVLCDTVPDSLEMSAEALTRLCTGKTLAVLPTHLAGRVADVTGASRCARAVGAWVIEDAAQAFGARTLQGAVGTFGDIGMFSLAVGKGLTLFEGGLLHVRDPALREEMVRTARDLLRPDRGREAWRSLQLAGSAALYRPSLLRLTYGRALRAALRADDPVGAVGDRFGRHIPLHSIGAWRQRVGSRALVRLDAFLAAGAARAEAMRGQLGAIGGIRVFVDRPGDRGIWPALLLLMPDAASRDRALARLWTSGLGVSRLFIHALPDYDDLRDAVPRLAVPNATGLAARSLTIGNSAWLTAADIARIVAVLSESLREGVSADAPSVDPRPRR